MKTRLFLLLALIVVTIPFLANSAEKPIREVVVGNFSAMTGPVSVTHLMCLSGSKDYLSYLNEEKGGIEGKKGKVKVKYLSYDTQHVASKAKDGFLRLRGDGMIVATHCASMHTDALMLDYEQYKIPLVTGSIGNHWPNDWVYGNYHTGTANSQRTNLAWMKKEWIKAGKPGGTLTVGVISSDEPSAVTAVNKLDVYAKREGMKYVLETFPRGSTDVSAQLLRLKNAGAWCISVSASAPPAVVIIRSANDLKLNIPLTSSPISTLGEIIALAGPELAEGYQGQYTYEPMSINPNLPLSPGMVLVKKIWKNYHPGEVERDMYVNGILSGMIIAEALKLALDEIPPEKLNGETVKTYGIDKIRNFDGMKLTAPFSYSPGNHHGQKVARFYKVHNGYVEPISEWIPAVTERD